MKNVFGYPYVKDGELRCDGERFVTERVDAGFKQELDKAVGEVVESENKSSLPKPLKVLRTVCVLIVAMIVLALIKSLRKNSIEAMFGNSPMIFYVGGACLVVWLVLTVLEKSYYKKVEASGEFNRIAGKIENLKKQSEEMLGVPPESKAVDVLSFRYTEKNGKVKIKEDLFYKHSNNEMKLYRDKDNLCLADIECVYSFPIADIKRYVLKKKKAEMDEWNKDTPFDKDEYKQYKIAANDYGTIFCKYYALQFSDVFGEYEIFFPVYELEAFKAIADAPVENE